MILVMATIIKSKSLVAILANNHPQGLWPRNQTFDPLPTQGHDFNACVECVFKPWFSHFHRSYFYSTCVLMSFWSLILMLTMDKTCVFCVVLLYFHGDFLVSIAFSLPCALKTQFSWWYHHFCCLNPSFRWMKSIFFLNKSPNFSWTPNFS